VIAFVLGEETMAASNFALPAPEGAELCSALGLAISNIAMYGEQHSVTATSVAQAFDTFVAKLDLYGAIEFVYGDAGIVVNGTPVETQRSTGQLLTDQLGKLAVNDFELSPPANRAEFMRFMSILAAKPGSPSVADGFEAAVADAKFESIRVAGVSYARVGKDETPAPAARASGAGSRSFDLDMEMGFGDLGSVMDDSPAGSANAVEVDPSVSAAAMAYIHQKRVEEEQRHHLLDMIRDSAASPEQRRQLREQLFDAGMTKTEWDNLLVESGVLRPNGGADHRVAETLQRLLLDVDALAAQGEAISDGRSTETMDQVLEAIRVEVARASTRTHEHADTLVEKVDADREAVSLLEEGARAQGIGLELSREELLANLAEINQELAQPLSAASAVVDMLAMGKLGELPQGQRDVLAVAAEGMDRLQKLTQYLSRISGLPEDLTPDRKVLDEAYGAQ
jgi:hypothetical protein